MHDFRSEDKGILEFLVGTACEIADHRGTTRKTLRMLFLLGISSPCPSRRITKISLRRRIVLTRIAFFRSIRVELFFLWGH
jgi:hypothetical protein